MPKYFFHVMNGRAIVDTVGLLLADDNEARRQALHGAGEMLADEGMSLWLGNAWVMTVTDRDGFVLSNLRISVDQPVRAVPNGPLTVLS